MEQIQLGDQIIQFDRERTRTAYAELEGGGAERCGCSYCRNFATQRSTVYPETFRLLLDQLGIDPEKEGEVYECGTEGSLRVYGGWFYFAGVLIGLGERMTGTGSSFQHHFVDAKRLPKPKGNFGETVVAVEFVTRLPWMISE
jgi:hypothetical protein